MPRVSRSCEIFLDTFTTDVSGLELEWDGKVWSIWVKRNWYFIAEQPAPSHPEERAALTRVLGTVPRVSRSGELFLDTFTTDGSGLELEWDGKVWSI